MGYHDEDDSFMSYLYSTSKNHKPNLLVDQWFDVDPQGREHAFGRPLFIVDLTPQLASKTLNIYSASLLRCIAHKPIRDEVSMLDG